MWKSIYSWKSTYSLLLSLVLMSGSLVACVQTGPETKSSPSTTSIPLNPDQGNLAQENLKNSFDDVQKTNNEFQTLLDDFIKDIAAVREGSKRQESVNSSKVNEKLSINYAASMTMPGQDYAGDFEDTFSARAGFVWKLGKATKPTQISMKDKKVMETKIESLEQKNKAILSKNQKLENKLSILMARLEKIEKIALGESKSKDLAVYKLQ